MTGIILLLLLAAAATAILWLSGVRGGVLKLALAAMLLGGAGYAIQGRPALEGSPATGTVQQGAPSLTQARHIFFGEFNASERWFLIADSYARRGKAAEAAGVMQNAVGRYPGDLRLWVGYANALVEQGRGLTPPARLAFDRAERLWPGHPATGFFRGIALLRSGEPDSALTIWREVLAKAPADANWRPLVEDAVAAVSQAAPAPEQQGR